MAKPHHALIAERAYHLWIDDGMKHGKAEHHWAMAEKLLAVEPSAQVATKTKAKKATKPAPRAKLRSATIALHS